MKICKTCVLPETFPGISFNEDGRCSYCKRYKRKDNQSQLQERFKEKFSTILKKTKNTGPYDALVAYSGGKDSTYTLKLIKEKYDLKILAITFDHGFVSPMALENIRNVTDTLDIDHVVVRPGAGTLNNVFRKSITMDIYPIKALERASAICNSCMNLVKSFLLKSAIEMNVPMVIYGWSPGQAPIQASVFKTNASMVHQMQKATKKPFQEMVGENLSAFLLEEYHYNTDKFPHFVHPLDFLGYNEENILNSIKEIGWINPKDTDANSTNCLLNGFANEIHLKQYGFHPYAFEIAGLVRGGYMSREEGLKKLSIPPDPKILNHVKKKLGIKDNI